MATSVSRVLEFVATLHFWEVTRHSSQERARQLSYAEGREHMTIRQIRGLGFCILLGSLFSISMSRPSAAEPKADQERKERPANRLAQEHSPYLRQHAHNPVDWYPWGPEAFEKARRENKPIFLSVGYSSCYWCHVMERRVFENEAIAKQMNENFVCIKVDREERPDLDDVYMTSLMVYQQAIGQGGGGGWPLSMFLTPEGLPIVGGTYFPPEDTDGAYGFPTVMTKMLDLWETRREQLENNAKIIATETRRLMQPRLALTAVEINQELANRCAEALASSTDAEFGGFDFRKARPDGPKFPVGVKLDFLQAWLQLKESPGLSAELQKTLTAMSRGGLQDHLGGGFHRYTVDRRWQTPHFEKMLYDQALLLPVYARAAANSQDQEFLAAADGIVRFIARDMTRQDGLFYTSLDAETQAVEGATYVWSLEEIQKVLTPEEARLAVLAYGIVEHPDYEIGNVLRQQLSAEEAAKQAGLSVEEFQSALAIINEKLLAVRQKREQPLRDEKIMTDWNSLMIAGLAEAGAICPRPDWIAAAEKAATALLEQIEKNDGRVRHIWGDENGENLVFLDDYAFLISALLNLHDATAEPRWLEAATKLQAQQDELFLSPAGGYSYTPKSHEELIAVTRNAYDSFIPAGNSVSARNLVRLSDKTFSQEGREKAAAILKAFAPQFEDSPRTGCALARAVLAYVQSPPPKVSQRKRRLSRLPLELVAYQAETPGDAPDPFAKELIRVRAYLSTDKLPAGGTCELAIVIDIKPGWHIQGNPPSPDTMIPTEVSFKSQLGTKLLKPQYPEATPITLPDFETPVSVYDNRVIIRSQVEVPMDAGGKTEEMQISVRYQACDDESCRPPKTAKLAGKLPVAAVGEAVQRINEKLFPPKEPPAE